MLNVTAPVARDRSDLLRGTVRVSVPTMGRATKARLLARYLEGWAEADPVKIAEATAPGYRFDDPFVGTFSTLALPRYFEALRSRAVIPRHHLSFLLRGPMDASSEDELQFWREAPHVGLTGTSLIMIGPRGVTAERVAYDLNIASEQLRGPRDAVHRNPESDEYAPRNR